MAQLEAAIPPPAGVKSNFSNPKDVLHTVNLVTQVLCIIVVTIFVVIRIWIKTHYHKNLNSEDCESIDCSFRVNSSLNADHLTDLTVAGWVIFTVPLA